MELAQLSEEQLAAELEKRQDAKKKAAQKAREEYEGDRHQLVCDLVAQAEFLHNTMKDFKLEAIRNLDLFKEKASKYGDIRSNSKGGFSIRSNDGKYKVSYERNTKIEYDERADLAEEQLREFLAHMVKKRDQDAYEIITKLLERGKSGSFNPAAIASLIKMEDKFKDSRWVKAIQLFKECHNTILISMNVSFFKKDSGNKDQAISLTFASIPLEEEEETEEGEACK